MNPTRATEFFKAGGTLHPASPSYVQRPADEELFTQVMAGQFCYVLTSRQRGKSSLMIRTAERLRRQGFQTAIVDLSGLGTQVTREQWYLGIIKRLTLDLRLPIDPEQWWHDHRALGPVQCFTDFLHDVALAAIAGRIVIFIDEVDSTLKLDFTDDFFAAIRLMYNLRASDPEYDRLTFVLLGVAAPTDLIKDRNRTPFNIGYPIELQEFSREDARPLEAGLEQLYPGRGRAILDRIFYWTNGHPYLTQRLCLELAEAPGSAGPDQQIDRLVERLFLAEDARSQDNLQFVRSSVAASPERRQLLQLYRRIYQGEVLREDERSPLQNRLRLIGLVRSEGGVLRVRNEIYRRVFNLAWIKESTPINWTQIVTIGAVSISVVAIVAIIFFNQAQQRRALERTREYFREATNAEVQISYLADLCEADRAIAQIEFFAKQPGQQLDMFHKLNATPGNQDLNVVIQCLDPAAEDGRWEGEHGRALLTEMCWALSRWNALEGEHFSRQIGRERACQPAPS